MHKPTPLTYTDVWSNEFVANVATESGEICTKLFQVVVKGDKIDYRVVRHLRDGQIYTSGGQGRNLYDIISFYNSIIV